MIQQTCSRWMTALGLLCLAAAPATAGVVFEIEVTDHDASPPRSESIETAVEGRQLKMEIESDGRHGKGDMIYRGDRREMVVVDHDDKSYTVMDEGTMRELAGMANDAMRQIQEALKDVPADQRDLIEQMMKEGMQGVPAQAPPPSARSELRKTGERAKKAGYPCVRYDLLLGGRKTRELWVTDWDNIEGGDEVADAFEDMSDFFRELMDSMPDFGQGESGTDDIVFEHLREMGGFPVVDREFGYDGSLESEATLRSARRARLDPSEFEPPAGYKRRSMGPQ